MEEEFYAAIKLVTGEEIVAKVSYDLEDEVVVLLNPRLVEKVQHKKGNQIIEGIVFDDWIHSSTEDMFVIPKSHVVTMIELQVHIVNFYEEHLNDANKYKKIKTNSPNKNSNRQNPQSHEGYLGSIQEAKKFLEEIYKKL